VLSLLLAMISFTMGASLAERGQWLSATQWAAVGLIVLSSAGATLTARGVHSP
jgi:threonine/homoserine efflux transporter RhtA